MFGENWIFRDALSIGLRFIKLRFIKLRFTRTPEVVLGSFSLDRFFWVGGGGAERNHPAVRNQPATSPQPICNQPANSSQPVRKQFATSLQTVRNQSATNGLFDLQGTLASSRIQQEPHID
jgi:hypothetical protein